MPPNQFNAQDSHIDDPFKRMGTPNKRNKRDHMSRLKRTHANEVTPVQGYTITPPRTPRPSGGHRVTQVPIVFNECQMPTPSTPPRRNQVQHLPHTPEGSPLPALRRKLKKSEDGTLNPRHTNYTGILSPSPFYGGQHIRDTVLRPSSPYGEEQATDEGSMFTSLLTRVGQFAFGLFTPPPSTKKNTVFEDWDEDDGPNCAGPSTPSKAPTRRSDVIYKKEDEQILGETTDHEIVEQAPDNNDESEGEWEEEEEEGADLTEEYSDGTSKDSDEAGTDEESEKYEGEYDYFLASSSESELSDAESTQLTTNITSEDLLSHQYPSDPYQRRHPSFTGPFHSLNTDPVVIRRLVTKTIKNDKQEVTVYHTDNGDALQWFQAWDLETLVAETVAREKMKLEGNELLKDVPQGRLLNYQMGMGKTHVGLSLAAESIGHIERMYRLRGGVVYTRKPVLIIAESSIQRQWKRHASELFGMKAVIYEKKGQDIPTNVDVIITNVNQLRNQHSCKLASEDTTSGYKNTDAPFFEMSFFYMIVDECHQHSNPTSISACALLSVKTDHVLLLSGTPAQNSLDDLNVAFSLLKHPSKRKNFRDLERIIRRQQAEYDLNQKDEPSIAKPRQSANKPKRPSLKPEDIVDLHEHTNLLIRQTIISRKIMDGPTQVMSLHPRTDYTVNVTLSKEEYEAHEKMKKAVELKGFVRILRCRQACLDLRLLRGVQGLQSGEKNLKKIDREKLVEDDDYMPSKTMFMLQILREIHERGEKTLIFSSFTSLLRRLSDSLDDHGIDHTLFHGDMSRAERDDALSTLAKDKECRVMLVSIKAGGTGLNITCCNNVIIMDPWWNPYTEEQAISRVHRLGQTLPVNVYHLIAPNTREEDIVKTQNQKRYTIDHFIDRCVMETKECDLQRG